MDLGLLVTGFQTSFIRHNKHTLNWLLDKIDTSIEMVVLLMKSIASVVQLAVPTVMIIIAVRVNRYKISLL